MPANDIHETQHKITPKEKAKQKNQLAAVIWLTGISGAGKSSIAVAIDEYLYNKNFHSFVLDGDNLRSGINKDLDFSDAGRHENIRRVGEIAKLFCDAGIICIVSVISPFTEDRAIVRQIVGVDKFHEVFVKARLETCEKRDPKGFYKRARAGEIADFTGIDSIYEEPQKPDLIIETDDDTLEESCSKLIAYIGEQHMLTGRDKF